jgi:hypothetical protein
MDYCLDSRTRYVLEPNVKRQQLANQSSLDADSTATPSESPSAFTRQRPVETDARSLSSKWFAPSQAQAEKRSKLPVRLKTRGTTRKRVRPRRDLNLLPL